MYCSDILPNLENLLVVLVSNSSGLTNALELVSCSIKLLPLDKLIFFLIISSTAFGRTVHILLGLTEKN